MRSGMGRWVPMLGLVLGPGGFIQCWSMCVFSSLPKTKALRNILGCDLKNKTKQNNLFLFCIQRASNDVKKSSLTDSSFPGVRNLRLCVTWEVIRSVPAKETAGT